MPQGLAYSVSGGWNTTPADHVGLFVAGGDTAKPAEFLAALRRVLQVLCPPCNLCMLTVYCSHSVRCTPMFEHLLRHWLFSM